MSRCLQYLLIHFNVTIAFRTCEKNNNYLPIYTNISDLKKNYIHKLCLNVTSHVSATTTELPPILTGAIAYIPNQTVTRAQSKTRQMRTFLTSK